MTEHELIQIAEHVEKWYDEQEGVGNPTGQFAEYIGRLLSHIGSMDAELSRLRALVLTAEQSQALLQVQQEPWDGKSSRAYPAHLLMANAVLRRIANGETAE